ncbi:MAG: flagellar hook-basal body complex protein FliE [Bacteroides sp.]|nr:flagellar hook-basal body complex protein FliE [Bacteroides sp.]MCM1550006.1 flagellar hook-basal body complex protein FliE [Clostridium sp.]
MNNITSITALNDSLGISGKKDTKLTTDNTEAFQSLLNSAISMYSEADQLNKKAQTASLNYAMGYSNNTHDLAAIQQKANIAIQYTVKVTNKFLEAYKEIMGMQL